MTARMDRDLHNRLKLTVSLFAAIRVALPLLHDDDFVALTLFGDFADDACTFNQIARQ